MAELRRCVGKVAMHATRLTERCEHALIAQTALDRRSLGVDWQCACLRR